MTTFSNSGTIDTLTIGASGTYLVTADGAKGGNQTFFKALIGLIVGIAASVCHFMRESLQPCPLSVRVLAVSCQIDPAVFDLAGDRRICIHP